MSDRGHEPALPDEGVPLVGGHMGIVTRSGDTVRRPAGPWTPRVQAFMRALRDAGVQCVPRPLGLDAEGAELVEFVAGDVGTYPMPKWVWDDALLVDVATRLRQLHDASAGLALPLEGWRREPISPVEVVCHGDVAPYNTVCRGGRVAAFIDWDFAVPAPRGWDLGYAAYRWVSLTPQGHRDGRPQQLTEQRRRLGLFCEAYGGVSPAEVVGWAVRRLDDLVALSRQRAREGDPAFLATIAAGHVDLYEDDARWLRSTYPADG